MVKYIYGKVFSVVAKKPIRLWGMSLLANLPLGDATQVLPGHESFSTLGQERSTNPYMNGAWY